jgi:hypothetical protein
MNKIIVLTVSILFVWGCTKKDQPAASSGWSDSQTSEISDWHFKEVSSKMQTLSTRGDNAKKEFSRCWTLKMAKEYSYDEYKKASKDLDEYVRSNHVVLTTVDESLALGQKYPFHQRMTDFAVECGNELKM